MVYSCPPYLTASRVDLGHEGARGVDHPQAAPVGLPPHLRRDAVGAEDHQMPVRHLVQLLDEDGALAAKLLNDEGVVDNFMANVHRAAEAPQRKLDNVYRPHDAGAEPSG